MIVLFALLTALSIIAYQDIRYRRVQWIVFPIVAVLAFSLGITRISTGQIIQFTAGNLLFIAINFSVIVMYIRIKYKSTFSEVFSNYLGLGDVLFWVAIAPLFSVVTYVVLFFTSLVAALLVHLIVAATPFRKTWRTVPLAGLQSVFYSGILILSTWIYEFSFYNDALLLQLTDIGSN